jgi:surfactin synthase thioesterase subunit
MPARPSPWFLRQPSKEAAAWLFCLPYSGCGASMYRHWPDLVSDIGICPIQLPGRENRLREEPYHSYEQLADDLSEALLPYLDRPFGFFGHCGSALPAYETTVRLVQRGLPVPACLFVSSQVAPHRGPHGRFLHMTDDELAEEVRTLIIELGGTPRPDMVELSLGVLRADVEANKRYRPELPVWLPCPISALGWSRDAEVDPASMAGWSECGRTTFRVLDGPHYGFIAAPQALLDVFPLDMGRPSALSFDPA